jgi:hypothetical protein
MIAPGKDLERMIRHIDHAFRMAGSPYWLCFGGLWGLICNRGTVPDGDLDICTYYGQDHNRIKKTCESFGWTNGCTLLNDTEPHALYQRFRSGGMHFCLSYWYRWRDLLFYCHDSTQEVKGEAVPKAGYWFRGMPAWCVEKPEMLRRVEWPGISGEYKISVPHCPGVILDNLYPDWAYRKQRYVVYEHTIQDDKLASIWKGGAFSRYQVYVKSMRQWKDDKYVRNQLLASEEKYYAKLKAIQ